MRKIEASCVKRAYVDGRVTIQRFLRAGLIQRLAVSRVPVLISQGVPPFGSLPHDVKLRTVSTRQYTGGWCGGNTR